jgi:transposase
MTEAPKLKTVRVRIPKTCCCPTCRYRQSFKKDHEHWKTVKDLDLNRPVLLKVQVIRAKCLNPNCPTQSFAIPTPGIERYARSTIRLKQETIAGIVADNSTAPRMAVRLNRCFNTTGSASAIYRWKQQTADRFDIKDIIARLGFSGILTLDEYRPKRARAYALIAGDALKQRILYMELVSGSYGRGAVRAFLERLTALGIKPWAVVFDLWAAFPRQVRSVWPQIIIQYDYFHVMQWIHKYLKNALLQWRRTLSATGDDDVRAELWEHKWRLLKNMDQWTPQDNAIMVELIQTYAGTLVEKILILKEALYDIFNLSATKAEAYAKRDALCRERWWQSSWHLSKVIEFLMSFRFPYMITYLADSRIPRSGNLENLNSIWRLIENARYGFRTEKGRLAHLKLYQTSKYLCGNYP